MTPLSDAERFARLRLARTDRVGPVAFSQLLQRFGSAVRAVEALPDLVRRSGRDGYALPYGEALALEKQRGRAFNTRVAAGDIEGRRESVRERNRQG